MNDLSDWVSPIERTFVELRRFFSRVPLDEKKERADRRVFRWVLCGEHGFGRNWREQCPRCGGYAEPLRNHAMAARLRRKAGG